MRQLTEAEARIRDPLHPGVMKYVIRALALYNGGAAFIFGGDLLLPWRTFDVSPAYDVMAQRAPEPVWGVAYLTLGLAQIFAHKLPIPWAWRFAVMVFWFYVAFMYAVGDIRSVNSFGFAWDGVFAGVLFALEGARARREQERRLRGA